MKTKQLPYQHCNTITLIKSGYKMLASIPIYTIALSLLSLCSASSLPLRRETLQEAGTS